MPRPHPTAADRAEAERLTDELRASISPRSLEDNRRIWLEHLAGAVMQKRVEAELRAMKSVAPIVRAFAERAMRPVEQRRIAA